MLHPSEWIALQPAGLYCKPGDFYIDPRFAVDRALITHAHADHARAGHGYVLATPETLAIMRVRYGENFAGEMQAIKYNETITHQNVTVTFYPAGHILGSAQICLAYQGARLIISGDYKRAPDPTCPPFTPEPCDVFITEATFGIPVFKHPPIENEIQKILTSLQQSPTRTHLIGVYALGKCQRVILGLRAAGYHETIYLHGSMQKLCDVYQQHGFDLGDLALVSSQPAKELSGKIILCPPSALHDRWSRKFGDAMISFASGWMQIRARAKQKGVELPLVISDHADWDALVRTVQEVQAPEVWVTHGHEDALCYHIEQLGFKAQALALIHQEEDD